MEQILPQVLGSLYLAVCHLWKHDEPDNNSHSWITYTWPAGASDGALWSAWTQHDIQVLFLCLQKDNYIIQIKSGSKSCSVHPGSSALISGMWQGHYTDLMACIHNQRTLGSPQWKQCTASSLVYCNLPKLAFKSKQYPTPTKHSMASCIHKSK